MVLAGVACATAGTIPADAAPTQSGTSPIVEIGTVRLVHERSGGPKPALLVPVRYPLYMAARRAGVRVDLLGPGGVVRRAGETARLSAGRRRTPDRRGTFRFVHRVRLGKAAASLAAARRVRVTATARLDADGDRRAEARSTDTSLQRVRRPRRGSRRPTCSSAPVRRVRPRGAVRIALPSCDAPVRWSVGARPRHGVVRRAGAWLIYRARGDYRGSDEHVLLGRPRSGPPARVPVQVHVGAKATATAKVRVLGDSVTAGFGYYDDGSLMSFTSLPDCRPASSGYNDACSSNSQTRNSGQGGLDFAPDYGLSNNISWAAQWANGHAITNYENVAVSGSAPGDWIPGGSLYSLTHTVEADDPDFVMLTLGANPLLSDVLFGFDTMGCALYSDLFGDFTRCVQTAFTRVGLAQNLTAIYRELLANTDATILLMQYHLSIPSIALAYTAVQLEQMGRLLNNTIASVAQSLATPRLRVITPPRFAVGIDMTPLVPNNYSCTRLGSRVLVDGPSVQATVTQDELEADHFAFCGQLDPDAPPWVISEDTGIHPSAAGYKQMASALPAP
jgi:lysophospholipase L1-like esterase